MRTIGSVCREVIANIEGARLPSLLDMETGLHLIDQRPKPIGVRACAAKTASTDAAAPEVAGTPQKRGASRRG